MAGDAALTTTRDRQLADQGAATAALPAISADLMVQALVAYKDLQRKLDETMPEQIMMLEGKPFRKKGFWRAVGLAFNLTVEPVSETRAGTELFKDGRLNFGYVVTYRATHPSGRSQTGDGACFAIEKARRFKCPHPQPGNDRRTVHFPHNTCPDFDPDFSWKSLPGEATEHNVRSHAHTRAFNRAVSNLVGFGEVSAEEVERDEHGATEAPAEARHAGSGSTASAKEPAHGGQPAAHVPPGATTVKSVTPKKGKTNDKAWTRYTVAFADGTSGVTFSDTLAAEAKERIGVPCWPDLAKGDKGTDFKGWMPRPDVQVQQAEAPSTPDEPVDGPEKILTVRRVDTDQGPRWIIQTAKRVLVTDQEAHSAQATEARAAGLGVVPSFDVMQTAKGTANRLKSLAVEAPREPGSDG